MIKFTDLELDPKVLKAIEDAGYVTPTPIQAAAIPFALKGRDVLGIAQTGTGKTASFVLPMITALSKGRARARMPRSLVLCPTRELAAQVAKNFETYSKYHRLSMALLIGGVSFKEQDKKIDRGVDVLIATPGRLLDHFERGKLLLTGVQIMVVDEADRMLDMGFIPDIERIFKMTPFTRQTLFFSATMAPEITRITQEFLQNPERVEVARQATTAENISQKICMIKASHRSNEGKEKRAVLRAILSDEGENVSNSIIFCNRKTEVDIVAKSLRKHGFNAAPIHGDLDQSVRTATLNGFREGTIKFLIASDVAARGLDVPAVSHVINFDVPIHSEDYVHRIGRTGRAGLDGKAITLCLPHEEKYLKNIEDLVSRTIDRMESPQIETDRGAERSRSRKRSDEKPASKPAPQVDRQPHEKVAPEKESNPQPSQNKPERRGRPNRGDRRNDNSRVVGMGDHVPAFIQRELRIKKTAKKAKPAEAAEPMESDTEIETPDEVVTENIDVVAVTPKTNEDVA